MDGYFNYVLLSVIYIPLNFVDSLIICRYMEKLYGKAEKRKKFRLIQWLVILLSSFIFAPIHRCMGNICFKWLIASILFGSKAKKNNFSLYACCLILCSTIYSVFVRRVHVSKRKSIRDYYCIFPSYNFLPVLPVIR